ncbi:MAG: putative 2-aminoethylphosphonate ABC transporter substrate-binding protein [Rhodospirillales bacterium]
MNAGLSKFLKSATFGVAALGLFAATPAKAVELTVYTAVEADELAGFKKAFETDNPGITISWIRDSTGIVTSKLMAEKDNPKADVVWGLAATSLMLLGNEGYFQGYTPKGIDKIEKKFYDTTKSDPEWVGQRAWIASICYNTVESKKHNLPIPTDWRDLTKPVYKDHVIMPNPNSSGTGFLDVSSWIQMMGEDEGWKFMDALHENISRYTHSGSAPCKLAARGETAIGVSFAYRGAQSKSEGAPLEVIAPSPGVGWDLESFAIVHNTKKLDAAKKLADWSISEKAMTMYNESYAVVSMKGKSKPVENFPAGIEDKMIQNDFAWAAANRIRILDEWRKRYDGKSDPK